MKAEERKELETNILAKQITKAVEGIKQGPSRGTSVFLILMAVAALTVGVFYYFYTSANAAASERWARLDGIVFSEQLDLFLADSSLNETVQGRMARFQEARIKLAQGMRDLASNPDSARKDIEAAIELYSPLITSSVRTPLLHQEALASTARAYEALGDVEKARNYYLRLASEHNSSTLGQEASAHVLRLQSEEGRKAAEELAKLLTNPPK